MEQVIKYATAFFGAAASYLFGGWSFVLQALIVLMIIDYVTGLLGNYGSLSSKIGFKGIAKKISILLLVAVAHIVDVVLGSNTFLRDAVIFFYLANELLSILENVGKTNLPIPDVLVKAVESLRGKENTNKGDGE